MFKEIKEHFDNNHHVMNKVDAYYYGKALEEIERLKGFCDIDEHLINKEWKPRVEELKKQLEQAQIKLNSIRFYVESPLSEGEMHKEILNVLNDPNHDGI